MTGSITIRRLPHGAGLPLPAYQSGGAAGMDLYAAIGPQSTVVLEPGARDLIPTGIALALPPGFEAQVRPRSGLALHHGVTVLNAPGTIDADYRGEIGVVLVNHGRVPYEIRRGSRIAQIVFARVDRVVLVEGEIDPSPRGAGGFGSTGVAAPEGVAPDEAGARLGASPLP